MKLRTLLIICFLGISVITQLFTFLYLKTYISNQYFRQFENSLAALSLSTEKRISEEISYVRDLTQLVANRTQLRISLEQWNDSPDSEDLNKILRIISDAQKGLHNIQYISIYNNTGVLVTTTLNSNKYLESKIITLLDKQDLLHVENLDGNVSLVSYYNLVLEYNHIGMLKISFSADEIFGFKDDRTGLGSSGEWAFAFRDINGDAQFLIPLKYDSNAAFSTLIKKELTNLPITQALLGNEIIMRDTPDYRGVRVLASTRYIPQQDWGLVAKIDMSEIQSEVDRSINILIIITLTSMCASIIAGIIIADKIAQPIEQLKISAKVIKDNKFSHPIVPKGFKETRELTHAFNKMLAALNQANESLLSKKVDERTQELQLKNKILRELSIKDPLTNLYNRRYFVERLHQEFERAKRYKNSLILVMLDIDNFKDINDEYGHEAGDEYLKEMAAHIQQSLRGSDIAARIGGEEFCIIYPDSKIDFIQSTVERIRVKLAEMTVNYDGHTISSSCSFGVAEINDKTTNYKELMKQADQCLYQAKNTGRNKVVSHLLSNNSTISPEATHSAHDKPEAS